MRAGACGSCSTAVGSAAAVLSVHMLEGAGFFAVADRFLALWAGLFHS